MTQGTTWNPEGSNGTECPGSSFQQKEIVAELGNTVRVQTAFLGPVDREGNFIISQNI